MEYNIDQFVQDLATYLIEHKIIHFLLKSFFENPFLWILILLIIFFIVRAFWLWYFKLSHINNKLENIANSLCKIESHLETSNDLFTKFFDDKIHNSSLNKSNDENEYEELDTPVKVIKALKNGLTSYSDLSLEMQENKDVALQAVKIDPSIFKDLPKILRAEYQIALASINNQSDDDDNDIVKLNMQYISLHLLSDKDFIIEIIYKIGGKLLKYASQELKADREIVLAAIKNHGCSLEYASEELKTDREVVLAAIKNNGESLKYASEELKTDRELVLAAVKNKGWSLVYASQELKADREIVLAAVKKYGESLKYASQKLKSDREIVLAAVKNHGQSLVYASEKLKADSEVVLAAVKNKGWSLEYVSEELKADREIVLAAVKNHGQSLVYASEKLKADSEVVLAAVKNNGRSLEYVSEELKADREVVLAAVKNDSECLQYASAELRKTTAFIIEVIDNEIELDNENYSLHKGKNLISKYESLKQKNSWLASFYRTYILWIYK